ncbi:luciferin 4-monooxygenase-like, partial [Homarus americanus]|uniref:luciferin 4-monooxygenase-like n=3 Tax=Homarus americanus TaxID=6706 RepID=UPI001C452F35
INTELSFQLFDSNAGVVTQTGRSIINSYGMTEAFSAVTTGTPDTLALHPDSVGKVVPYIQVKFVDVRTGRMVGERQEGEVCVRGSSIMLGYANNPTATASTIDPYGWLHTGDVDYYDQDNFVYLTGRIKDLIKVKGYQVSPAELEKVLLQYEGVEEAAVVGVPPRKMGEAPRAYVVPTSGTVLHLPHLQQFVA